MGEPSNWALERAGVMMRELDGPVRPQKGETGKAFAARFEAAARRDVAVARILDAIRHEALKEAAAAVRAMPRMRQASPDHACANGPEECAQAIGALLDKEPRHG